MGKNRRALSGDIDCRVTIDGDMEIPKAYMKYGALADLTDVDVSEVTDGQVLKYDAEIEKWVAGNGGTVEIDDEMSDSSENAVQNKVIKAYVDGKINHLNIAFTEEQEEEDIIQTFTFS